MSKILSLKQVVDRFAKSDEVNNNPQLLNDIHIILTQYCLPAQRNLQSMERAKATVLLSIYSLFHRSLNKIPDNADLVNQHQRYKATIRIFRKWCKHQDWYTAVENYYPVPRCDYLAGGNYTKYHAENHATAAKGRYGLKRTLWNSALNEEVNALQHWLTTPEVRSRPNQVMRAVTWHNHEQSLVHFFGWRVSICGCPISDLTLDQVSNIDLISAYIEWHVNVRNTAYRSLSIVLDVGVNAAKFLVQKESYPINYDDVEEVQRLKHKRQELNKKSKQQGSNHEVMEHIIPFEHGVDVVDFLKEELAPHDAKGRERNLFAMVSSWRKYLMVALLLCCPVRQREIRELELGRTLWRREDRYWVVLTPEDHKTGAKSGQGREYPLPQHLTADLDYWLQHLRPQVTTNHDFVFFKMGNSAKAKSFGQPASTQTICAVTTHATFRALDILGYETKGVRPHDFRRIAITFHRQHGDRSLDESLAELMGHSVKSANRCYDLTTSRERTTKATGWWDVSK